MKHVLMITAMVAVLVSCKKEKDSKDTSLKLSKTEYGGCFENTTKSTQNSTEFGEDTIYYAISGDSLNFYIDRTVNCCALLKDSVVVNDSNFTVFVSDSTEQMCECICEFNFLYHTTGFLRKNIDFKVYWKSLGGEYNLWKETTYIGGLD